MKPLSSRNRFLYVSSVLLRRFHRKLQCWLSRRRWARVKSRGVLPFTVTAHKSLLLRELQGIDSKLQLNKIESLKTASASVHGVLIKPGETFSFWKLVGRPSPGRGFPPGLQLSFGTLTSRAGGGLCQLSNLLHWMVLQTPMEVLERHRHATDPFPDHRRTVPFGTGATVFYNYLDFCFFNPTDSTFQILVSVGKDYLEGTITTDSRPDVVYSIQEKNHGFSSERDGVYRMNEIWRTAKRVSDGGIVETKLLMKNRCRVLYEVNDL